MEIKYMLRIILVLPGSTDLDTQGRITGCLDVPLNSNGAEQVRKTVDELGQETIHAIYSAPCQSAQQTAEQLSRDGRIKVKVREELRNLDHGLWHGKRIKELKDGQPRVYRQWQDDPETCCPPRGEMLEQARQRLARIVRKIKRRYKSGTVAIVIPEPAASILRGYLENSDVGDLWKAECRSGSWETIVISDSVA